MAADDRATATVMQVPFIDLAPQHGDLKRPLLSDLEELIESGRFTNGPEVQAFEEAFAGWCGSTYCVGLASGLDALRLALLGLGVEPGDEVIVPALTFVATVEAITQAGAVPILVDVLEADYALDPAAAEQAIGSRAGAIVPVHLYGQMADVRALRELAERRDLILVEDACQAHGAARDGLGAGTAGAAAAFSFYPGKNLGAMGDAGAVVTEDGELVRKLRALREHGQTAKYRHEFEGYTARLDTLQALVLLHKLPHLLRWNDERRTAAAYYLERLQGVGDLALPPVAGASQPVWHLFVVRTADPQRLGEFLRERGIGTGRHYPQPIHLTDAYRRLGHGPGDFPVSERVARECLSLPMFPGITEEQLDAVTAGIVDFFARG